MRREHFDHVIAAAASIVGEDEFVVVGSQAILGSHPDAPDDGALGDGSPFQRTFGYYAHGVGVETAKAPAGWRERLIRVRSPRAPRHRGGPSRGVSSHTTWCSPSASPGAIADEQRRPRQLRDALDIG